jgi:hypothetical protein
MSFTPVSAKSGSVSFKKEVTQGVPVAVSGASDFTAIQEDFSMSPGYETADNAELANSILPGKQIVIGESPSGSISHYLRPSGVIAQAPDFGLLLEAGLGSVKSVSAEQTVLVGSTVSSILVTDASEYQKGDPVLVKSSTGFEIRAIESVVGNTINVWPNLENVPSTGAGLGRPVTYQLEDDSDLIPTLTAHYFLPGVYQMMAGCRVTTVDCTFTAKDLINCNFSFEGTRFYYNPLTVDASNQSLDISVAATEYNLSIKNEAYQTPITLAEQLESALNSAGTGLTFVVSYSKTGFFTISADGAFDLLWSSGTNNATSIGGLLGYDTASDDTGASSYQGDNEIDLSSGFTPSFDSLGPLVGKGNSTYLGADGIDNICLDADEVTYSINNTKSDLNSLCADSGVAGSLITARTNEISISAYLEKYSADKFQALNNGDVVKFFHAAGNKLGGNFKEGECVACYTSHAVINNLELSQTDGVAKVSYTLTAFSPPDSSQPSYIGFV